MPIKVEHKIPMDPESIRDRTRAALDEDGAPDPTPSAKDSPSEDKPSTSK